MGKMFIISQSNLRKTKGQTTAIIILMLLAALMLNLWLMLSTDYKKNFYRYHDKLNAEHVTLAVDGNTDELKEFFIRKFENDENIAEVSLDSSMHMVGLFEYNGGELNSEFVILEKQAALLRSVGRIEIIEDSELTSGIYMPILYKSDEIAVGKTIELFIGSNKVSYTVCGFFNSIMAGSHNCSMCEIVLTEDSYNELKKTGYAPEAVLCSIRLKNETDSEAYEAELKNYIALTYPDSRIVSNSYELVSQSRYISQMICSGIISAMAFFILLISIIVIASNIVNYIQVNMKNLGVLKALGYTSRQLILSLLLQFCGISVIAAAAGIAVSYCLFPFVNKMMAAQTGIPYKVHFLLVPVIITFAILEGAVIVSVWLSSKKIKKIEPITALRQGVLTHNFKRNYIPLESTKFPLNVSLALKTTFSGIKHNITVCITMLVLSLIIVFSGLMIRNVIADITPFINFIVGETADSCINVNTKIEEEFLREVSSDNCVEKVYLYNSVEVQHVGGAVLLATMSEDFSKVNNQDVILEGRFPKYDNEIAIGAKYAKENGFKVGNEITITANGKEGKYIISGFTQISNMLGKDCLLTRKGYERLGSFLNTSYYLNLSKGTDIEEFNLKIKEKFGNEVNAIINIAKAVWSGSSVYISLMRIIVIAVLTLSAVIIVFVMYLLVRTMLINKRKEYGILKAVGFTTRQLIVQTALSFMPAVIFSMIIGIFVSSIFINPLTTLFIRGIGIVECRFIVPVGFVVLAGTTAVLFVFAVLCVLSLKIKKIVPKALLIGE